MALAKKPITREKLLARAQKYDHQSVTPDDPIWREELVKYLRQDIVGPSTDHEFRMSLEEVGRSVARRSAYMVMTGKTNDASGVRDGWALQTLAGRLFERVALAIMQRFRTYKEVKENKAGDLNFYWYFAQIVWGQLSTGLEAEGREGLDLLGLCELREGSVLPALDDWDHAEMPRALNNLLRAGGPTAEHFDAFKNAAPLQKVSAVWHDDQAFEAMLFEACDWHLRKTYPGGFYIAGFALFPSWLFALNRYRQNGTGKSCLPNHPLIEYGKRILAADFSGPAHPLVAEAEAEYARRYANKPVDFAGQWRKFLDKG